MAAELAARHREQFLDSGRAPEAVRQDVASSWMRCWRFSLAPERLEPPYRPQLDAESQLMRAARPMLDDVHERLCGMGISFLVCDSHGAILHRSVEEPSLRDRLDALSISAGHVFAEDAVGTNGIGTAIELGRTVRIDAHEHYWDALSCVTCVGAPIVDPIRRTVVGVLDVTCAASFDANATLELVAEQTARAIERRLLEHKSLHERVLLDRFLSANSRTRGGLVVLSDRLMLANARASRLLGEVDHPQLWEHASRALSSDAALVGRLTLRNGCQLETRATAVRYADRIIGSLLELRVVRPVRASGHGSAAALPGGLIGGERFLRQAAQTAAEAVNQRIVIISGEPGVGKAALGRALLGQETCEADCGHGVLDGELEWVQQLAERLTHAPAALLVRHAQLLGEETADRLVAMLDTASSRGVRCVVTWTSEALNEKPPLPALDAERVRLPPLRDRLDDLPALAASYVRPRRVAPEIVQVLGRAPWAGNLAELRTVLDGMLEASQGRVLTVADIPPYVRQAAVRRPLSRFERAQTRAMLDALAETGGNKQSAAMLLGISRSTLYRKLRAAGIDLDNTVY